MQSTFSENEISHIKSIKQKMMQCIEDALFAFPMELSNFIIDNCTLSGGATASIFHGDLPNDWDLYLSSRTDIEVFNEIMKNPVYEKYIADVVEKYSTMGTRGGKLITANAVTFQNKIQVITMQTSDQLMQFDMIHCMPRLVLKNGVLYISRAQYDSIRDKKIELNTHVDAARLLSWRIEKYKNRGWK